MIQVQNLVKKFGDFTAVKDISFTVRNFCLPRPEWCREDNHHQDADHAPESNQRKD